MASGASEDPSSSVTVSMIAPPVTVVGPRLVVQVVPCSPVYVSPRSLPVSSVDIMAGTSDFTEILNRGHTVRVGYQKTVTTGKERYVSVFLSSLHIVIVPVELVCGLHYYCDLILS